MPSPEAYMSQGASFHKFLRRPCGHIELVPLQLFWTGAEPALSLMLDVVADDSGDPKSFEIQLPPWHDHMLAPACSLDAEDICRFSAM
jgi:hypothetical protein